MTTQQTTLTTNKGPLCSIYCLLKCLKTNNTESKVVQEIDYYASRVLDACDSFLTYAVSIPSNMNNAMRDYSTHVVYRLRRTTLSSLQHLEARINSCIQKIDDSDDIRMAQNKQSVQVKLGKVWEKTIQLTVTLSKHTFTRSMYYTTHPTNLKQDLGALLLQASNSIVACTSLIQELYVEGLQGFIKWFGSTIADASKFIHVCINKVPSIVQIPGLIFRLGTSSLKIVWQGFQVVISVKDYQTRKQQITLWILKKLQHSIQKVTSRANNLSFTIYQKVVKGYQKHKFVTDKKYKQYKPALSIY